ncbi:uridine kinase-like protein 1, chloroplastic isoform X1 [Cajanus cajan]|uniref:uridine kinase-like protein 1, chloroplastic isoform X1 n=1 Tax=Cajanus cajan TaxID=3821 RepID=UPI00098DCF4E|nr:uridine kinase-like protein 1, chloroplastic isoform X1 [Cajanus cajan]
MDMVIEVLSGAHFSGWHPSTTSSSSPTSSHHPFVIGVSGGTASGKTTVCDMIIQQLQDHRVVLVCQDSFYRGLTNDELKHVHEYNFDHPNAFDTEQLVETISKLKSGQSVQVPIYDFKLHQRSSDRSRQVNASEVIILEGILVFHEQRVRNMMNMKIFVDADPDVRLARRIRRDTVERGRDVHSVLEQYAKFVKPAFDDFILPSKKYADIIIPRGGENRVAIDLIVQHIRTKLGQHNLCKIYPNLNVIQSTFQTRGMHTLIRDKDISKHDFVFYSDRLIRLVVEHGLGYLPFTEKQVITPTGSIYTGVDFCKKLCGVSIIRSGESMENALRACCKGIKIGKILIHRGDGEGGETQLIYEKLPKDISERHVLLMDPVLGTGNTASQAIELLIKKGVPESQIIFLNLISAPEGIHCVCKHFPHLKLITSEIEEGLNDQSRVIPGLGEFGDRYFGTDDS